MSESKIKLYSHKTDHVSHRVRLVLSAKQINYERVNLSYGDPDYAEVEALSPYAGLPLLVDRSLVVFDQRIMIEYLDERYRAVKLLPDGAEERARTRLLAHRIEHDWIGRAAGILNTPSDHAEQARAQARSELSDILISAAPLFARQTYFLSDSFGLCDAMLLPVLWRLGEMNIALPAAHSKSIHTYMERHFASRVFKDSL